ncbi:Uncharacterised protein [Vibrio cholerae]|nr:Uncharacterised protein [Vibrio cholerae]
MWVGGGFDGGDAILRRNPRGYAMFGFNRYRKRRLVRTVVVDHHRR